MSTKVEIIKAQAFELDPNKKYVIVLPRSDISMADAARLGEELTKMGITSVGVIVADPNDVKVVQA